MDTDGNTIHDWQALVNKPAFASDGKEVGIVSSIQPKDIIISSRPVIPDKYHIPKTFNLYSALRRNTKNFNHYHFSGNS